MPRVSITIATLILVAGSRLAGQGKGRPARALQHNPTALCIRTVAASPTDLPSDANLLDQITAM
jgi:hypothetical protein